MPRDSTVGTREFKNPDEVRSAGGELEMQPVQSVTLPGQPTHECSSYHHPKQLLRVLCNKMRSQMTWL